MRGKVWSWVTLAAALGAFTHSIGWWGGNVRTVAPGRFYRSAQLSGRDLGNLLRAEQIRTVITLREGDPSDAWWQAETATCRALGVAHREVGLRATHLPSPQRLQLLLHDLDTAERPVLIHCRGGADRSGLVSALYLVLYEGLSVDAAVRSQLSWRSGHLPFKAPAMQRFFELYRQTGGDQSLRSWMLLTYPSVYARLKGAAPGRVKAAA